MDLNHYLNSLNENIRQENGRQLANLLSLTEVITIVSGGKRYSSQRQEQQFQLKYQQSKKLEPYLRSTSDYTSIVSQRINFGSHDPEETSSYVVLINYRLKTLLSLFNSEFNEAFQYLSDGILAFLNAFHLWSSELLWKLSLDLRLLGDLCNRTSNNEATHKDHLEEAARVLNRCFQTSISDRTTNLIESKKNATMGIINQMFKIYWKINNLKLCKNLITTIKSSGFPQLESYPILQLITYRYFSGRLSAFNGNYKEAQQDLLFAFNKCPNAAIKNKRSILLYLIPIQLHQCKFPTKKLLEQFKLFQYMGIVESVRTGNIKLFNQCLSTHQNFFIAKGIYLILEKLKIIVYRNLFKKVHLINQNSRIPITHFVTALRWMENESVDIEETECILANLIYSGYLKGYISHKVGLVVSPTTPFPNLPLGRE